MCSLFSFLVDAAKLIYLIIVLAACQRFRYLEFALVFSSKCCLTSVMTSSLNNWLLRSVFLCFQIWDISGHYLQVSELCGLSDTFPLKLVEALWTSMELFLITIFFLLPLIGNYLCNFLGDRGYF